VRRSIDHAELHRIVNDRSLGARFFEVFCDHCHPTDSLYLDPIFGAFYGREAIRAWLVPVMTMVGNVSFDATEPPLFVRGANGEDTSLDEWVLQAVLPDGSKVPFTRGASVRKFRDGWVVYAADYFDTHPMRLAQVQAASEAAGSSVGVNDVSRFGGVTSLAEQLARDRKR